MDEVAGCVDQIKDGKLVRGWARQRSNASGPVSVRLMQAVAGRDDRELATALADWPRSDGASCGFSLESPLIVDFEMLQSGEIFVLAGRDVRLPLWSKLVAAEAARTTPPDGPRIAVITGMQRSGTTVIGRLAGAQPSVRYVGEVFHQVRGPHDDPDYRKFLTDTDANFFTFKERLLTRFPQLAHPTLANQQTIWSEFKNHLFSLGPEKLWVVDIKYNSYHHFDPVWRYPCDAPLIIQLLKSENAPLLHIVRRDVFAQAVSSARAEYFKSWHDTAEGGRSASTTPVALDVGRLIGIMSTSVRMTDWCSDHWRGYGSTLTIEYETAFSDGDLVPEARVAIANLLGLSAPLAGNLDLRKIAPEGLKYLISNRENLMAALKGTPFENLAARHLA